MHGAPALQDPEIDLREYEDVPFVDLGRMHLPILGELAEAFRRVTTSSAFIGGREVEAFEEALAAYLGVDHVVGVGSGTAALHLTLVAAGIGAGDEVIVPANTFFATAEAVIAAGATPVVVDVSPETALMEAAAVEAAITGRTAAVIPVHLYGQPVNAPAIAAVATRHGLLMLEDAAQAIGAAWDGRLVGRLGDAAAFSFYPGKNLGALGDGGAVTTNDPDLARRVAALRSHGEYEKGVHSLAGLTERLDGMQAAFLAVKLPHLDTWQEMRNAVVARYTQRLAALEGATLFSTDSRARHVHHLLVVQVANRDDVLAGLRSAGIGAGIHYPTPVHLQPAWKRRFKEQHHPVSEHLARHILSLPLYPHMSDVQVDRTVDVLAGLLKGAQSIMHNGSYDGGLA